MYLDDYEYLNLVQNTTIFPNIVAECMLKILQKGPD